ncbi:PKHD-type hydroxylase [Candidatus Phycosocius spiralis]|uniref:PKHD-type hydroxylase n=2 Tax=Candidatus Phycosocius spiralis TaxID=2815099 RepID=A0ABQ4PU33_9PROT|nr:PKHD-type hydroxylase [Candidatus Phycosocius spiralis]
MLMLITIKQILAGENLTRVAKEVAGLVFTSGKSTAGAAAKAVKDNQQASGPEAQSLLDFVRRALDAHTLFQAAAQIMHYGPMLISRYQTGMSYGLHVDNAFMSGVRADLSFTLFLSDANSYDGGALALEQPAGRQSIKLDAGDLVLYPSTSLHEVEPVTRGERVAVVGWVQSRVLHAEAREALFDIAQVRASLSTNLSVDPIVRLTLQKAEANLIRLLS